MIDLIKERVTVSQSYRSKLFVLVLVHELEHVGEHSSVDMVEGIGLPGRMLFVEENEGLDSVCFERRANVLEIVVEVHHDGFFCVAVDGL
jgi:hypothetical protein